MDRIILATHNAHKVKEFKEMLPDFEIVSLDDLNEVNEPVEDGKTLKENAYIKAKYFYDKYNECVLSDDTGLLVDALDGMPGVYSARYASLGQEISFHDDKLNREKLLKELEGNLNRNAHFECVLCLINKNGNVNYFEGKTLGTITNASDGSNGFGYDSIFYSLDLNKTFGKATNKEKDSISHRGRAILNLKSFLNEQKLEEKVINISEKVFKSPCYISNRLLGGMSNYTYVITNNNKKYTVRIPGTNSELFTDRKEEHIGLQIFEQLNLTTKTIYFDEMSGIKISEYIEGVSLNEINDRHYDLVSDLLKKLHSSNVKCDIDYEPFNRLNKYESYLNGNISKEYLDVKNKLLSYKEYFDKNEKVFCHNDSQPSNFIYDLKDNIKIVDFEFVGNNDYIYDIACFGNIDFNDALTLLNVYENGNVTLNKLNRLNYWRSFQCLQWHLVASFKELSGMSAKLKIDFDYVSKMYLDLAKKHLANIEL